MTTTPQEPTVFAEDAQLLQEVLDVTKGRFARVSAGAALSILGAAVVGYVLLFVVADHLIEGGVPKAVRFVAGMVFVLGGLGGLAGMIVRPLFRRISDLYAARMLERRHRVFRNSLVSAVQLERCDRLPGSVRAAIVARAAADAVCADVSAVVGLRGIRRAAVVLGATLILFGAYAFVAPKAVAPSVLRAFGSSRPAPTRTFVLDLEPANDASVIVGRPVTFVARLGGYAPSEAYIEFRAAPEGPAMDGHRLPLQRLLRDGPERGGTWQGTQPGADIQQTMFWRLHAADARAAWRRLEVRPTPDVTALRVTRQYPAYTRLSDETREGLDAGDVEAVEGTQVTIDARTNVPVRDPVLIMNTAQGPEAEVRLLMQREGPAADRIVGRFNVTENARYWLQFFDRLGQSNVNAIRYDVKVQPDRPPVVDLAWPTADQTLAPDEPLVVRGAAEDDFGVSRVEIEYRLDKRSAVLTVTRPATATQPGPHRTEFDWRTPLSSFKAQGGDVIEWRLVAWDNRADAGGRPLPQKGAGPLRRVVIMRPDSPAKNDPKMEQPQPPDAVRKSDDSQGVGADAPGKPKPGESEEQAAGKGATSRPSTGNSAEGEDERGETQEQPADRPPQEEGRNETSLAAHDRRADDPDALKKFMEEHKKEIDTLRQHLGTEAAGHRPIGADAGGDKPKNEGSVGDPKPGQGEPAGKKGGENDAAEAIGATDRSKAREAMAGGDANRPSPPRREGTISSPATEGDTRNPGDGAMDSGEAKDRNAAAPDAQRKPDSASADKNRGAQPDESPEPSVVAIPADAGNAANQAASRPAQPDEAQPTERQRNSPKLAEGGADRESQTPKSCEGATPSPGGSSGGQSGAAEGPEPFNGDQQATEGAPGDKSGGKPVTESESTAPQARAAAGQPDDEPQGPGTQGTHREEASGDRPDANEAGGDTPKAGESTGSTAGKKGGFRKADAKADEPQAPSAGEKTGGKDGNDQNGENGKADGEKGEGDNGAGETGTGEKDQSEAKSGDARPGSKGESPSESDGGDSKGNSADASASGNGEGKQDDAEGKNTTPNSPKQSESKSAGASPGAPLNAPTSGGKPNGADETANPSEPAPPPSDATPSRQESIGDVFKVVDALEQQIRRKELDPSLLEELDWNIAQAERFVREFKRVAGPVARADATDIPSAQYETAARRDTRVQRSDGVARDAAPLSAKNARRADGTQRLQETGRQNVPREYRDVLEEYYRSAARQKAATSRPTR